VGEARRVLGESLETFQGGHFSCPDAMQTSYRAAAIFSREVIALQSSTGLSSHYSSSCS